MELPPQPTTRAASAQHENAVNHFLGFMKLYLSYLVLGFCQLKPGMYFEFVTSPWAIEPSMLAEVSAAKTVFSVTYAKTFLSESA